MDGDSFRAIVGSLGDGILVVNRDGKVTHGNAAADAILGCSVVGGTLRTLAAELRLANGAALSEASLPPSRIAAGEDEPHLDAVARRTGKLLRLVARPLQSENGGVEGIVSVLRDVTAERQAEEELREARTFIDSIVENIPDMIFVKDAAELRFERFNRAGEELLGLSRDALLGKTDHDFFPPEQAEFFQRRDRETLSQGTLVDIPEEPIDTARGRRWLHTKKIPILDAEGKPLHLLGISSDITERRATEEALRRHQEELEGRVETRTKELRATEEQLRHAQKLEAVGRLAGGVAHDFNNVLAVILGHVGLLERSATDASVREGLESIRGAAEHAAALTRQLLAFSRKQSLQPRVLSLNRVVEHARAMLARLLGEDVRLSTVLAKDLGNVHVDPALIEQVIVNLAVNARDAMPNGGVLTIETRSTRLERGHPDDIPELDPGPYACLVVRDTGVGMDEATRARIFEPFFTTKASGKGTGLGLSMAYGVITQSGGAIRVKSAPGEGTTFSVYLPVAIGRRSETPPPGAVSLVRGGGQTILLAEDEAPLRTVLRSVLRDAGYVVLVAEDGSDALRLAAGHPGPIDLLVTDVVMPGMTGPELARRLRASRPSVRVLFMSGYADERLGDLGVDDASAPPLAKPFTTEGLTERVRKALDS